jgi:hypothetical protein
MLKRLLSIVAVTAAFVASAPATDTSSIKAFVASCSSDANGCKSMTLNAVISARSANYGCIPKDTSNETAAGRLLDWLKGTAAQDPKYANEALSDLMWTGIDEVWPCKK